MKPPAPDRSASDGRQACDVMAFGQEVGRVLSDGRIVGRAEPFAKVFPSSRGVKRAVGLIAWGVLEDIALDARIDDRGRLVAETNVRRIADNLGLSKTTVQKHLVTLKEFGVVLHEEMRRPDSGRYEESRYVIDPRACIERFTHTPAATSSRTREAAAPPAASHRPPARVPDSGTRSVSQSAGHGDLVQNNKEGSTPQEQHHAARATTGSERDRLHRRLTASGMTAKVAGDLLNRHTHARVMDALDALTVRSCANPAGWLVRAIDQGWDVAADAATARAARARARVEAEQWTAVDQAQTDAAAERARGDAWARAVSAALDDRQLATAVARLTRPLPGVQRRSAHAVRADLVFWAHGLHAAHPGEPLAALLTAAVGGPLSPDDVPQNGPALPPAPELPPGAEPVDLSARLKTLLATERDRAGPVASRSF